MLKTTPNFAGLTPVKIGGGMGETSIPIVEALLTTEPPETFDSHPLRGC